MASIRKRGKNSYQIIVSTGYDGSGTKLTKTKTVTIDPQLTAKQAEKEVQRQAILFEKEIENGTYLDGSKMTFAELIDLWLKDHAEKQLQPKTLYRYTEILTTRILPAIGHLKLQKLQPTHLLELYSNLQEEGMRSDTKYTLKLNYCELLSEKGLSLKDIYKKIGINEKTYTQLRNFRHVNAITAQKVSKEAGIKLDLLFDTVEGKQTLSEKTIKQHHAIIHSSLEKAVEWQLLLMNPADRVKPPKVPRKEARHLNEEQAAAVLEALQTEPLKYQVLILLDLITGVRRGELMALVWKDIDIKNQTVSITKSLQYIPGQGQSIKETKTESSNRIISIPKSLNPLLLEYKLQQNGEKATVGTDIWPEDNDWVFTRWNGELMHVDSISKWFPAFLKRHNMPPVNFHAIRHTAATLLINQGLNIKAVSSRLGHANTSTTVNIYGHALRSADKHAADLMEKAINPKRDKSLLKQG